MRRPILASMVLMLSLGPVVTLVAEEVPPSSVPYGPAGALAAARAEHTAALLRDGRIFIVGGWGDAATPPELWDPATGTSSPVGPLIDTRAEPTVTLLLDGRVLIVGGWSDGGPLASAEIWDPVISTSGPTGSLVEARSLHTATLLHDGRVLVIGGDTTYQDLASAEAWDPATGMFEPAGALGVARVNHTATLLHDGRVLVIGGSGVSDDEPWLPASSEVWDPATGMFEPAGALSEPRSGHTATLLHDGRVLVIGGSTFEGGETTLASAEIWDPETAAFEPTGSLDEAREYHTATLLPNSRVFVIGGDPGGRPLASAEVWDPATGTFAPAGSLVEARDLHTATLLPDGRVLVIGGDHGGDVVSEPLASVEVCCQAGAGATAVALPSPSPFDGPPQRVELPEAGFAVSVPGDWDVERIEVSDPWNSVWLKATSPAAVKARQRCTVVSHYLAPRQPGVAEVDTIPLEPPEGDPTYETTHLELPAGRARLSVWSDERPPFLLEYSFTNGTMAFTISCVGDEAPDDRGLSIAESFEILPIAPERMELSSLGFAVTFPGDWMVLQDDRPVPGEPDWRRVLWARARDAVCRVEHASSTLSSRDSQTVEDDHDRLVDSLAQRPKGETPESTYLDLPAGRSGRVDWALHGETSYTGYSLTDGATSLRLVCLAKDPPADRWRSIAKTFEFLPQGE